MSRSGDDATAVFEMAMGRAVYASRPASVASLKARAIAGASSARVRDLERRLAYPGVYATRRMMASVGRRLWRRAMLLLLRATGRRPVGEWVPRVEAVLAHCRARAEAWFVRMVG